MGRSHRRPWYNWYNGCLRLHLTLEVIETSLNFQFNRFIAKHFEQMKPLAEVDPLFLQVVVYICPKKELPALMKQIPPFVSATWLSSTISKSTYLYMDEVSIVL